MYEHQSLYPTGSIRAAFSGPDNAVTITITDLRAAGPRREGIVVSRGRKKYTSYAAAAEAALVMVAKMTGHTVEQLKSGEFYQGR